VSGRQTCPLPARFSWTRNLLKERIASCQPQRLPGRMDKGELHVLAINVVTAVRTCHAVHA
jgi:hypothetical protein